MCLSPGTLKRRQVQNGQMTASYPCGKCVICIKRKQRDWVLRLTHELKSSHSVTFLTLTYENYKITPNGLPTLDKRDYQLFLKKLRKSLKPKYYAVKYKNQMPTIKYYACGEYGKQTQRPHYHAIMFNLPHNLLRDPRPIQDTWNHGHIDFGDGNLATMRYVTKYLLKNRYEKLGEHDDRLPEFSLMSKGLGKAYLTPKIIAWHKNRLESSIPLESGEYTSMPRYYREKIFNTAEKMAINRHAEYTREIDFNNLFNNDYRLEHEYKKRLILQFEKELKQEIQTL